MDSRQYEISAHSLPLSVSQRSENTTTVAAIPMAALTSTETTEHGTTWKQSDVNGHQPAFEGERILPFTQ